MYQIKLNLLLQPVKIDTVLIMISSQQDLKNRINSSLVTKEPKTLDSISVDFFWLVFHLLALAGHLYLMVVSNPIIILFLKCYYLIYHQIKVLNLSTGSILFAQDLIFVQSFDIYVLQFHYIQMEHVVVTVYLVY